MYDVHLKNHIGVHFSVKQTLRRTYQSGRCTSSNMCSRKNAVLYNVPISYLFNVCLYIGLDFSILIGLSQGCLIPT